MKTTVPTALARSAAILALAAAACAGDPTLPEPGGAIVVAFSEPLDRWPADDWDLVDTATVDGGLELTVAHAGGCRNHDFWLVAVNGFHELYSFGPTPLVSVPVLLAHDAHGDACEAYITRTQTYDLQPLLAAFRDVYATPGRLLLRIPKGQGARDSVYVDLGVID